MPSSNALGAIGLNTIASLPSTSGLSFAVANPLMASIPSTSATSSKAQDVVVVAPGTPGLKRSMVELILSGAYIDLVELPPAKGSSKPLSALNQGMEGHIVLPQAADLAQSKKLIPDAATWVQCFSLYTSVVVSKFPERAQSLLCYMATICKFSKRYKWPSWLVYDQQFCQEAADTGKTDWSKIDGTIHTFCFNGQSIETPRGAAIASR